MILRKRDRFSFSVWYEYRIIEIILVYNTPCVFQMIFENIKKENLVAALNYIDIHHIIA